MATSMLHRADVPGDDLLGVCGAVGGEHQQFPDPVAGSVTHGYEPSGAFAERAVPQAGDLGDVHGAGAAVAGHGGLAPGGAGCGLGGGADPVALGAGASPLAGGERRWLVEHGVALDAGGPGDPGRQVLQGVAVVGGVGHQVDGPVGKRPRQQPDQGAGQLNRGGGALAAPQPKQHWQAGRPAAKRQRDHDPDEDPSVAAGGHVSGLGGVVGPKRMMDLLAASAEQAVVDGDVQRRARR